MTDQKTIVISVRLTPALHATLASRATSDRQPLTRMAALLIEDALTRPRLAQAAPMVVPAKTAVAPFFRTPKKKGDRP